MGTITTYSHCLVKDGVAYEGTKEDIVHQICKYRLDSSNNLFVTFNYYIEKSHHGYGKEPDFTLDEMHKDIINYIFNYAKNNVGFKHYRNLNF